MPMKKLKEFLDRHGVKYTTIIHSPAFTAQEMAASANIPGKELAKTVVVKIDGEPAMLVLPASNRVVLDLLKEATDAEQVEWAHEEEFRAWFPGCEVGAMPPFGNLFEMEVYVSESLTEDEEIVFNAGSHTELIRMPYREFERLVQPQVVALSYVDAMRS